jgi:hypothetical protein
MHTNYGSVEIFGKIVERNFIEYSTL